MTLSNYAYLQIVDQLKRLPGVGDVQMFGERRYSMRVWLDPDKLANLGVTAVDVQNAIAEQNVQVAAGKIGQSPAPPGTAFELQVNAQGRLTDPEEFSNIIVRADPGERRRGAPAGCRARRTRRAAILVVRLLRQRSDGRDGDLPDAGLQRARPAEAGQDEDGGAFEALPAWNCLRDAL